jgi:tRNA1(Val) A37 N6-methylase TrmN6
VNKKQEFLTQLGGRVKFRAGIYNPTSDAVWLAAFFNIKEKNEKTKVLDAGVGTGAVALHILARSPDLEITGIDNNPEMLAAAAENSALNGRGLELINADILTWKTARTFDAVVSNPPYFNGTAAAHRAHHSANIAEWTAACIRRLCPGGTVFMIADAGAAAHIIAAMKTGKCGGISIVPLNSIRESAERVLISGKLNSKSPARIFAPLNMNDDRVLKGGLTLCEIFTSLYRKC